MTTARGPLLCAALALLPLACSRPSPEQRGATATGSASASLPKSKLKGFTAKVDGGELALDTVVAFSRGGSALHLTFSTHPLGCDNLAGAGFQRKPGEVMFDLTLAPSLAADGSAPWHITGARIGQTSRQGALAPAKVEAFDPREMVKASFAVALSFPPYELQLDGGVSTEGCGVIPWSDRAQVRPQKSLRVEIAGKRIPINGASVSLASDGALSRVRLTSEPHACDSGLQGSDYGVELYLATGGEHVSKVSLGGYSLSTAPIAAVEAGALTARAAGDLAANAEVDLELVGETQVRTHRLTLDGTARAQVCKAKAAAPR